MNYRTDRKGEQLSQLGFGCMRFSRKGGTIDYEKTERELLLAMERGVNYFDTAYIYPGSEETLGRVLEENHCRAQVKVATKLPQYVMRSPKAIEKTFQEELTRLRTDYIDFYLMHMFTDFVEWENLKRLGIEEWIAQKKASGAIRNIGFSYHGNTEMFLRILNAYDWDFCQIQYNYLDEFTQAGRAGLEAAQAKGIPVVIMEPLRGGRLVNLPEDAKELLRRDGHGLSPAALGLRWLWDQPGVTVVLSGMNSVEMVEENCRLAGEAVPGCMDESERKLVEQVRGIIRARERVGCTGCRYCMPCPKGVDIPGNFHYYNMMYLEKKASARREFFQVMGMRKEAGFASQCVGCGRCETHCPQHLPIRQLLKEADRDLRPLPFRVALNAARLATNREKAQFVFKRAHKGKNKGKS